MRASLRMRRHNLAQHRFVGADSRDILKGILKQGALLIIGGVTMGLLISLAATRALATLLYDVSPADPLTYAVVTIVLVITALVACYIPAWRATKVDPLVALRYE